MTPVEVRCVRAVEPPAHDLSDTAFALLVFPLSALAWAGLALATLLAGDTFADSIALAEGSAAALAAERDAVA